MTVRAASRGSQALTEEVFEKASVDAEVAEKENDATFLFDFFFLFSAGLC